MIQVNKNTPIAALTVGQFQEIFLQKETIKEVHIKENEEYVYGLRGIRKLFNVSHVTAQRYKDTFLAPAIKQVGRKIITNKVKALELFTERED